MEITQPLPGRHGAHPPRTASDRRLLAKLAKQCLRWSLRLAVVLVALLGAGYLGLLGHRHLRSAPAFDDPVAYIDPGNCMVSSDGKTAYLSLQHTGTFSYRDSLWAIDVETLERTALPNAALALFPSLPANPQCFALAESWDGKNMLGALMRTNDRAAFFSMDLAALETKPIDVEAFHEQSTMGGWSFERVPSSSPVQPSTMRASRKGANPVAPFTIDTNREPAVPLDHPLQFLFTDSSGAVHRVDGKAGTDVVLPALQNPRGLSIRVSRDGRWLSINDGKSGATVYEIESGRSRAFPHSIHDLLPGDMPVLRCSNRGTSQWTMSNLDEERTFVTETKVGTLRPLGADRFLGIDSATEAAYVLDHEGRLLKTLRAPAPPATAL